MPIPEFKAKSKNCEDRKAGPENPANAHFNSILTIVEKQQFVEGKLSKIIFYNMEQHNFFPSNQMKWYSRLFNIHDSYNIFNIHDLYNNIDPIACLYIKIAMEFNKVS